MSDEAPKRWVGDKNIPWLVTNERRKVTAAAVVCALLLYAVVWAIDAWPISPLAFIVNVGLTAWIAYYRGASDLHDIIVMIPKQDEDP